MGSTPPPVVIDHTLRIHVTEKDGWVCCRWLGKSLGRAPSESLGPHWDNLLAKARESGGGIEIRLEDVAFVNSQTIVAVVAFARQGSAAGIPISIYYSGAVVWQQITFTALAQTTGDLAGVELIDIDTEPAA